MNYTPVAKALTVEQAVAALRQGKVIAYPTEAVWGLGCDPFNAEAVKTLLRLKRRPVEKGVILVAADVEQLQPLLAAHLTQEQLQRLKQPRERPTTWLVPYDSERLPKWISGEHDTVAVRISSHPGVKALCKAAGMPIISTSANPQGCQPAKYDFQVRRYFHDQVMICRGQLGKETRPSTIIDLQTGAIIRG